MACRLQFTGFEEMHNQLMDTYLEHIPKSRIVHGAEPFLHFVHTLMTSDLRYTFVFPDIPDLVLGFCLRDVLCAVLSPAGAEIPPAKSLFKSCGAVMDALDDSLRNDRIVALVWPFMIQLMEITSNWRTDDPGSAGTIEDNVMMDSAQQAVDLLESVCFYYFALCILTIHPRC
jgi:hypothetical protein